MCKEGKVPQGMIFVPYGPPTCRLMGQTTDGTGMPTSKGWEVEVEPIWSRRLKRIPPFSRESKGMQEARGQSHAYGR